MVREVVSAAIRSREKKITANTGPAHILENTIGRLWNTSVGPELGATPKLKREGKIIKPANTAINVLVIAVITAV